MTGRKKPPGEERGSMQNMGEEPLETLKIGIMGCGHLGQAVARLLLDGGVRKENLFLSYRGNPETYRKLAAQGLDSCLTENRRMLREAEIVLIMVRPQDILTLKETAEQSNAVMVSCMAGIPAGLLRTILGTDVSRMMFSGPDTLLSGKGVAALYPESARLSLLLRAMGVRQMETGTERDLNLFTAGVCLPAALLKAENPADCRAAMDRLGVEYPLLSQLFDWAGTVLPAFACVADKEAYIGRMITRGGITEALANSLSGGAALDEAMRKAIARTEELSLELQRTIAGQRDQASRKTEDGKADGIMEQFEQVTVVKKANIYFDGRVTSRTVLFADGTRKTLGIILPGRYEFGTADKEQMEVLAGKLNVLLPGREEWLSFEAGQTFEIPAGSRFQVSAEEAADYCCSYIRE